jgi:hypothetical protein
MAGLDHGDGQFADYRARVAGERRAPLLDMLRVPPLLLMRGDVAFGRVLEGHLLGRRGQGCCPLRLPRLDRINALKDHLPALPSLLAGFGKADRRQIAEAAPVRFAPDLVAEDPAPVILAANLQPEATAITVPAGLYQACNLLRR